MPDYVLLITGQPTQEKLRATGSLIAHIASAAHAEMTSHQGGAYWLGVDTPGRLETLQEDIAAMWEGEPVTVSWLKVKPA